MRCEPAATGDHRRRVPLPAPRGPRRPRRGARERRSATGDERYLIVQYVDVTDRKRFEGQLRRLADTRRADRPVQPPPVRRGARVDRRLRRSATASPAALLAIDVDHFQYINDSYGHATGDELLGTVTALLRSRLRETDIVGRLGGDEFGVILPQTALEDAETIAPGADRGGARAGPRRARRAQGARDAVDRASARSSPRRELTAGRACSPRPRSRRNDAKERGRDRFAVVRPRRPAARPRSRALTLGRAAARGARERRLRALRAADPGPRRAAASTARSC